MNEEHFSSKQQRMYMRIAKAVAKSGTCDRARVGAVLVRNGAVIGTGYNGSARGDVHCDDVGHLMSGGHCIRTIHAEENAILNAAKNGAQVYGSTMFCTHRPCYRCIQRMINAGVASFFFDKEYGKMDKNTKDLIEAGLVTLEKVK